MVLHMLCRVICLQILLSVGGYALKISLDGVWTGENKNASIKFSGQVPGGIYSDLTAGGILNDIYYRNNDRDYRWVAMDNWIYHRSFQVDSEVLDKENIMLVFHGLDTVATIYLNEVLLGTSDNMFVRYKFHVKQQLQVGNNTLRVEFQSPVVAAKERYDQQAQTYEVPPKCVPPQYQGECHVNHLRKMQASFSWDWGPSFPSVGLWKSVELEAFNTLVIRDITTKLVEGATDWELKLRTYLEAGLSCKAVNGTLEAKIELDDEVMVVQTSSQTFFLDTEGGCEAQISISVPKNKMQVWWPNGFGSQKLYKVTVTFFGDDGEVSPEKEIKIGFRSVELVEDPVFVNASQGLNFYFRVNNVPIFAKGSNWIPAHVLPELSYKRATIYRILRAAKLANMNMLRVWGGGLYESDEFYQIADELGILIWQDLMFACSMYPTSPDFLQSVSVEVAQQVRRLQHHPSIALWAGNNENEAALRDNWYGTASNFSLYKEDYIKLYVNTIRPVVTALDTTRPYVVSSPSNGIMSEQEGYIAEHPYSSLFGDIHYYNYLSNGWNPFIYPRGRFISEYGFQSLPSLQTIASVSEPTDRSVKSEFSQRRQHHPLGYSEITMEIKKNMMYPADAEDEEGYHAYTYLSQINQAMSTKTETEVYRRNRNLLTLEGEGRTMGALYWQLNDIWQGPSWASIEYGGKWKMLHHFAKNFFAPVLVSPVLTVTGDGVKVYVISDLLDSIDSATLEVLVYSWDKLAPLHEETTSFSVASASAEEVTSIDMKQLLSQSGCGSDDSAKQSCFLTFSLLNPDGIKISPDNFLFLSPLHSAVGIKVATITVTQVLGPEVDGEFWKYTVKLSTDNIALFVWLEVYNVTGYFSDNGFLMATSAKQVHFYSEEIITSEQLQSRLTTMSLLDVY